MNLIICQVRGSKAQQTRECEDINGKVNAIGGPMHGGVVVGEIERCMKLGYDLRVTVITKAHKFLYAICLICLYHTITNSLIQICNVIPIYGLHWSNLWLLGSEVH